MAAFVELLPETGVRHQLRLHLSEATKCQILGDHKYLHSDRFLYKLKMRQGQVRNVPCRLHAASLVLPKMGQEEQDLV